MNHSYLGIRQRTILEQMYRNGGIWPANWRLKGHQLTSMLALERRGLVALVNGTHTRIDKAAEVVVSHVKVWRVVHV